MESPTWEQIQLTLSGTKEGEEILIEGARTRTPPGRSQLFRDKAVYALGAGWGVKRQITVRVSRSDGLTKNVEWFGSYRSELFGPPRAAFLSPDAVETWL